MYAELRDFAYRLRKDLNGIQIKTGGTWLAIDETAYVISRQENTLPLVLVGMEGKKLKAIFPKELKARTPELEKLFKIYAKMQEYDGISAYFNDDTRLIF